MGVAILTLAGLLTASFPAPAEGKAGMEALDVELSLRGPLGSRDGALPEPARPSPEIASHSGPSRHGPPGRAGHGWSSPSGAAESAVRVSAACFLGVVPGLGHAASGTYLYRGLSFSLAFLVTTVAGGLFIAAEEDSLGGVHAETGAWVLMMSANVIYVWSLVDALILASAPPSRDR